MPLLGSYLLQIIKSFKMISDDCIFKVQIILKMKNLQLALRNACTFRENHLQNSILCKQIFKKYWNLYSDLENCI